MTKIVLISDTHNQHNKLTINPCDILIHCGDATGQGRESEIRNFAKWFDKQPAKHKLFSPGNHELYFEKYLPLSRTWFEEECPTGKILINESIEVEGIKFYLSPITPSFFNWAFMKDRGQAIANHWKNIPDDTQFLITHGPPKGILDYVPFDDFNAGCEDLLTRILELKNLKHHAFGHLHTPGGQQVVHNDITFINCAVCNEDYYPMNKIMEIEI